MTRSRLAATLLLALTFFASARRAAFGRSAPAASPAAQLAITGDVEKPLTLSLSDLASLPQKTVTVMNTHDNKQETYDGVALADLLGRAGVPQGSKLKGAAMATYVIAQGSDAYRVIFSLAELDSDFQDANVIVADKLDGQPLPTNVGPLRLVVPNDKRPGRWVRMLQSIRVVSAPK